MNAFKPDALYLVSDDETKLVYARVATASVATGVTLGILNSVSFAVPVQLPHKRNAYDAYDFNKDLYQVAVGRAGFEFKEFPKDLIRDDLLEKKALARDRGYYIYCLEVYCENFLARIAEYMPDDLSGFLRSELESCRPEESAFSNSIREYAELLQIEPHTAYQELQLRLKSSSVVKLRNYALQQKFMLKMNARNTKQGLEEVFAEFIDAMIYRAFV